jgi:carbon monoxide dehydrogenase subunit G
MAVTATELIQAPRERVWEIITDIEHAAETISAITDLTVLERPAAGVIGLKWTEARRMFGKEATETMWISAAEENRWYETTAKSHGSIYHSRLEIRDAGEGVELSMSFDATPTSLLARIMSAASFLFNGTMKKAIQKDLKDIKRLAES